MGSFTKTLKMQASAAILAVWLFVGVMGREPYHTPAKDGLQAKAAKSAAQTQYMDCYDYQPNTGDQLRAIDYIPQLLAYNFDNIISYCCVTGIWLLYQDENFNADLGNLAGKISSARHGCYCGSSLKPNNHAGNVRGSQRGGNSEFFEARDSA